MPVTSLSTIQTPVLFFSWLLFQIEKLGSVGFPKDSFAINHPAHGWSRVHLNGTVNESSVKSDVNTFCQTAVAHSKVPSFRREII